MQSAVSMVMGAAVALPWLWPWATPPSPAVPGLLAAWCCTAALWFSTVTTCPNAPVQWPWRPLLVLGGLVTLAALRMPVIDLALLGGLVGSVVCVLVAAQSSGSLTRPYHRWLCWGLLAAAMVSTVIAGLQYCGLLREPFALLPWLHASPNEEAYGQLRQRNQFGSLMSLGLAAWLYLAQTGGPRHAGRWWAGLSLLVLTVGAAMSASRTGALTWMGLCLLALVWPPVQASTLHASHTRRSVGMAWVGFVVLCGLLPILVSSLNTVELPKISVFQRLASQPEGLGACESRLVLWRHVLELSWQRPWLGWGWGELDLAHATQAVTGERFCSQLGHAHNLLLHAAVEWGWPLALLGLGAVMGWIWRHPPWHARSPEAILGWSWLGVIGLHSGLEFPLWYGPFQLVAGLALGLVMLRPAAEQATPRSNRGAALMQGTLALWLTGTLWASWDYHRVSQVFLPASQRSPACRIHPADCLDEVVWFHQGRDFAQLSQGRDRLDAVQAQALARRVAHFAPEPWVLSLTTPTPRAAPH